MDERLWAVQDSDGREVWSERSADAPRVSLLPEKTGVRIQHAGTDEMFSLGDGAIIRFISFDPDDKLSGHQTHPVEPAVESIEDSNDATNDEK